MGGLVERLEAAAAEAIDRGAAGGARQAGEQADDAADVEPLLLLLLRIAEDDVFDRRRVDAGPLDEGLDHRRGKIVGAHVAKDAALGVGPPDRGPAAVNDHWSFHGVGISLMSGIEILGNANLR
jgi:hypothetical protein